MKEWLRSIPPVHELQNSEEFKRILLKEKVSSDTLTNILQTKLNQYREEFKQLKWEGPHPSSQEFKSKLFNAAESLLSENYSYTLNRVINATGTILHTNLGRARLSREAINHVNQVASHYYNLEYDSDEGKRGSRHVHTERILVEVTGAEAAMVVNNNAAAVYLVLSALARDKEVIVSRGELIEIGGSFRVSSIMEESGAHLVEVGTTNKTHLYDYQNALTEETSMIMKVHKSNFIIKGFSLSVNTEALVKLAKENPPVIYYEDLGSGVLFDFKKHGIGNEPVVQEVVKNGADLVSFSGDKLLGGPQAGIIVGKKTLIDQLKKHQLARVLRVDKMTLAALEATLMPYLKSEEDLMDNPTIAAMLMKREDIKERASQFLKRIEEETSFTGLIQESVSQVGGGTMPDVDLETYVITLNHPYLSANDIEERLRQNRPIIVTRIHRNEVVIDLRTVNKDEQDQIIASLKTIT
ncbi:L-seryl-tRNA(Ser) seleniumtransferase [Bacillus pakistanensis]|uniref:L-seryl-tRNA(Sec) selenium transferase n=1 Tax=Rossellomorea pakistanensis TaxID=992288 RepID=A0ABS2N8I6_9BACI|nr:L-seryl-tRNA(Sec) selenium transferase [Bacillus pakistanensis]MBM7583886.1 L-seryl-tRNA(Ser) seleniumtransferase [Bacillus pakistanensis]